MIGGYSRYDGSGYRGTTLVTVAEVEAGVASHRHPMPVSGDATTRWVGK